ncbi:MAG TPA: TolC family protein [Thermoanaerobaculaceae bacterium]|nr:TolC family protein [Thermoanaerobaculaceae bacterium]HRS17442.1 TolC family protein [Thermoanaerobaculaceae bacterium]
MLAALLAGGATGEPVRIGAAEAAARAVEVSPLAVAARERVAAADATAEAADAARQPTVSVAASLLQRSSVPEFVLPIAVPGQPPTVLARDVTTVYGTALQVQQVLLAGGAVAARQRAARLDAGAARARAARALAELRLAAQLLYWDAVRAGTALELARAHQRRALRLLADTQALLDAGMAVRADLLAAEERLATARLGVVRAEAATAAARSRLASLLALDERELELADTLAGPLPDPPADVPELQAEALAARPEIQAARAERAALAARETLAVAAVRPSLAASAQWELARPNQRYFPVADEWNDSWSVGLAAGWKLFDGGAARAERAASRARQRATAAELAELERLVRLEVEDAARELATALAATGAADAAAAAAAARQTAARERHASGLAAMAEILDAETQLAAAEQQQVAARTGAWVARAALERAVGR